MADDLPVFRVPVVVWLDAPGCDLSEAEWVAKMALGQRLHDAGKPLTLPLHRRDEVVAEVKVVRTDDVWGALQHGRLVIDSGRSWAAEAGGKPDG